jgi:carbon-monoxide dehydrogenase medium subunit
MSTSGYAAPTSLKKATKLLATTPGARLLAGGQELLVGSNRQASASLLVDLRKVPGLTGIDQQPDGELTIGAMTTLAQLAANPLVRATCPALGDAAHVMGDAQLRNRATLGGHLASADPDADLVAAVLALDSDMKIVSARGSRTVPAHQLIVAPYKTILEADEVLVSVRVPARATLSAMAYERFRHPATLYAICGVCANVALGDNGRVTACHVAVTGAADYPRRLLSVERNLLTKQPDAEIVASVSASAGEGVVFRSDLFASAEYRRHLTRILTERALKRALKDAGADIEAQNDQQVKAVA